MDFKLTQYSHGAGCGCKIAPSVLDRILHSDKPQPVFPGLLVGNETRDDAAVFDLGDGTAAISTTDFFMPIVDDAAAFGRIASVNAISDVYAMGGTPLMAIAVLGWPIDKLPPEVARKVVEGSRQACAEAGIPLAGGHSIDSPEPIFGLAVTGRVRLEHLKRNGGATPGCQLYLTKPLGVGVLTTAEKKGILRPEHAGLASSWMQRLNCAGECFGRLDYVAAMTDVTGFGLLGHLGEMCDASDTSAVVQGAAVPLLDRDMLLGYLEQQSVPGGTHRNWSSYGHRMAIDDGPLRLLLADPQTSGGLLVAVAPGREADFENEARAEGLELKPFGFMIERRDALVTVV